MSNDGSFALELPLVIDEYDATGITIFTNPSNSNDKTPMLVQISALGPLILKEAGNDKEHMQIKRRINGSDSLHIQSPKEYDYPSGKEGDCLAQANILVRNLKVENNEEMSCDSLSIDLYIRRELINALKATWKSVNGWLVNIGSSAAITALVALATFWLGSNIASLIPYLATIFILLVFTSSVLYSWYTRDALIKRRLESNNKYQELKGRVK